MLLIANWLVLFAFWFYVFQLIKLDRRKLALGFSACWVLAYFSRGLLGITGPLYFLSFEALLTFVLIACHRYVKQLANNRQSADLTGS